MTQFIGIDLAWGEGTATKPANETGLAIIDESGAVLFAGWARGIAETAAWLLEVAEPGAVVAIDAPLVIPNATGMRLAEREVGMGYGSWQVSANASNQAMGWKAGETLRLLLDAAGFVHDDGILPVPSDARRYFECYPYTTLVGMEELGYDNRRPRYKRFDPSLPPDAAKAARIAACDDLIERLTRLTTAEPPLAILSHPVSAALVTEPSPIAAAAYKHREDLLDAVLCAWTASIWSTHETARVQVLGATDTPGATGKRATILAPARPSQRVAGRTPRPLRTEASPGEVLTATPEGRYR